MFAHVHKDNSNNENNEKKKFEIKSKKIKRIVCYYIKKSVSFFLIFRFVHFFDFSSWIFLVVHVSEVEAQGAGVEIPRVSVDDV